MRSQIEEYRDQAPATGYERKSGHDAVGAILAFAVHASTSGFSIHTVGIILLAVGAVGAVMSMVFWSSWGGFGGRNSTNTTTVVHER